MSLDSQDPMDEAATAVCGAFLMVAFADGQFSPIERVRMLGGLANDPRLANVSSDALERVFNALAPAFEADYPRARDAAISAIEARRADKSLAEAVAIAARAAVVADAAVKPQEELAIDAIEKALDLPSGSL